MTTAAVQKNYIDFGAIRSAAILCILPIVEFLVLRVFLHSGLKLRIGYAGMTDYDVIFPAVIAFFLLMAALGRTEKCVLNPQTKTIIVNVALFLSFCGISFAFSPLTSQFGISFRIIWFVLAISTIVSALFVFIKPSYFLFHADRILLLPFALIAGSKLLSRHVFASLWQPMADQTGIHVYKLVHFLLPSVTQSIFFSASANKYTHISHPNFTVAIGIGCSGMEGVSLGMFVLMLGYFIQHRRFSFGQWGILSAAIVVWMYTLNVVRISLFFILTLGLFRLFGQKWATVTALTLFHNSLGWILYSLGLFGFHRFFYSRFPSWQRQRIKNFKNLAYLH